MTTAIDQHRAKLWTERWDAQQERYVADREERFDVVGDVVEHATREQHSSVVVDLGCGPGSLSGRLAHRLPGAEIIGVDADPLLLGLGRAHYTERVRFVDADLADPTWPQLAGLPEQVDAAVSATALHWLEPAQLEDLYARLADHLRPGGVFVNADHLRLPEPAVEELALQVRAARATRVGVTDNEDWHGWWDAVLADETLAPLVDERSQRAITHGGANGLSADGHGELLRKAGFTEVGTVWQSGDDHVLVGVR